MIKSFQWKRAWRKKAVWFSLFVMLVLGLVAVLAPWIAPHDPYQWRVTEGSLPPSWVQNVPIPGDSDYPLGTDRYGRDILSRMIYGTRTAIFLALAAVSLAALIGTLVGLVAGYAGGRSDSFIMLFVDMLASLPGIMVMVIIVLIFRTRTLPHLVSRVDYPGDWICGGRLGKPSAIDPHQSDATQISGVRGSGD